MKDLPKLKSVRVIDSHTAGEPTRVVISGGPELGRGSAANRLALLRKDYDSFRSSIVNEPRGSDVLVGALLLEPSDPRAAAAVIFFNNVSYLGMCGHGTIGVVKTLHYLGKTDVGFVTLETPVGLVSAELFVDGSVSIVNVPSYRFAKGVEIDVPDIGKVVGDIAWGGNWFFLVTSEHGQTIDKRNAQCLTIYTTRIKDVLAANGVTGKDGAEIDHVELFTMSSAPNVNSRNFVLCPGNAYDRSPCGTVTSAKMACLYEDGKLAEREVYRQESVIGSIFVGSIERVGDVLRPTIRGNAFITGDCTLLFDPDDPFRKGIN